MTHHRINVISGIVDRRRRLVLCAVLALIVFLARGGAGWTETLGPVADVSNEGGVTRLFSAAGPIEVPHLFAQSFGANDRMCVTCHGMLLSLFAAGANLAPSVDPVTDARRAIASGEAIFNTGVASGARRTPDLPVYTLSCSTTPRVVVRTTDPGRALVTERCQDIGSFKVPALRGLAARPPFFHDGSTATLRDVVLFYDDTFGAGLRGFEVDALVAFLRAL